jgi:hypothetical protein
MRRKRRMKRVPKKRRVYNLHYSRPGGVLGCDKWMKKHLNI